MCNGYIKIDNDSNVIAIGEDEIEVASDEIGNQAVNWAEHVRSSYDLDYVDTVRILKALLIGITGDDIDMFETYGLSPDGTEFCEEHKNVIISEAKQSHGPLPNLMPMVTHFRELNHVVLNKN